MIQKLFTDIAAVYDRMNHLFSLGRDRVWREKAVACVPNAPAQILDLACGTGDLSAALLAQFPAAVLTGVDFTPAMLEVARAKIPAAPRVCFMEGDATKLPPTLTAGSFDLVSCAFGFRNISDKESALRESARMLKQGGCLLVLEFFRPRTRLLGFLTAVWLRALVFVFIRSRSAAYAHLRHSMAETLTEGEFVTKAQAAGFHLLARRFFLPCCTCLVFGKAGGLES